MAMAETESTETNPKANNNLPPTDRSARRAVICCGIFLSLLAAIRGSAGVVMRLRPRQTIKDEMRATPIRG
ncbi:hypothetical protein D9M73_202240 [compost metagenome]